MSDSKGVKDFHFILSQDVVVKIGLLVAIGFFGFTSVQAQSTNPPPPLTLKLSDYVEQVLQHNNTVQAQMLETEAGRHKAKAEYGIFEPSLDGSATREANRRLNNAEQQSAASGLELFDEQNNLYNAGLQQLVPTGAKVQMGYSLSDLRNNYPYNGGFGTTLTNNTYTKQYQTFVGVTVTQPLLKGAGMTATMAGIRLAAMDSDIAFQQYRRQLMLTVYQAESAYWNLYFAQEQIHFFDDSVAVAQTILDDTRERLKAGSGAELDVMEAQSGLALRNTKRNDVVQNYYDALGRLRSLTSVAPSPFSPVQNGTLAVQAADNPQSSNAVPTYADCMNQVWELNPDYLIQWKKTEQEALRLGVAKNQLLPELNAKGAYGYNGLALSPDDSWDSATSKQFPSWSIGLELSIPLGGNIKGRHLYSAAKLSLQEAYLNLKGAQTQIANDLSMSTQKAQAWRQSIESYQTVVNYNEELLKTQLERLKAGAVGSDKVLETEANLLDSRQDLAGALTQYRRALSEVELATGNILKNRNLDIDRERLKQQTRWLLDHGDSGFVQTTNAPAKKDPFLN